MTKSPWTYPSQAEVFPRFYGLLQTIRMQAGDFVRRGVFSGAVFLTFTSPAGSLLNTSQSPPGTTCMWAVLISRRVAFLASRKMTSGDHRARGVIKEVSVALPRGLP